MGRELKRVALDFDWPLDKTWGGYINPFYSQHIDCPECDGGGYSPEAKRLSDMWYGNEPFKPEDRGSTPFKTTNPAVRERATRNLAGAPQYYGTGPNALERECQRLCDLYNDHWCHHLNADDVAALVAAGRLHDFTHTWTPEDRWQPKDPAVTPTPDEVNRWSITGMGHDAINQWAVVSAECERHGWPKECSRCGGSGEVWPTPAIKQQAEDWERTQPPEGEGYQLWQTVGEGSPISPVFGTPEELADWLSASPDYTWRKNDAEVTRDQWLKFINGPGWAPSMVGDASGLRSGVTGLAPTSNP